MPNDLRSIMTDKGKQRKFDGSTVVYCPTRKATEACQAVLQSEYLNKYI